MKKWKDDDELFSLIKRELFTAVVGDILAKCGYLHQFLPAAIRPLAPQMVIVGRALTVLEADVFEKEAANSANPVMRTPSGLMYESSEERRVGTACVRTFRSRWWPSIYKTTHQL